MQKRNKLGNKFAHDVEKLSLLPILHTSGKINLSMQNYGLLFLKIKQDKFQLNLMFFKPLKSNMYYYEQNTG